MSSSTSGTLTGSDVWGVDSAIEAELSGLSVEQITSRIKMLENNIRATVSEKYSVERALMVSEREIEDNKGKIRLNKQLPYLVANVVEVCEINEWMLLFFKLDSHRAPMKNHLVWFGTSARLLSYRKLFH